MKLTRIKLGDVLDIKRGTSLSGDKYATSGRLIRLTLGNFDYFGGGFKENTSKENIYYVGSVRNDFIMQKGDIITPLTEQVRGLLGETARIPVSDLYIQSQDIGKVIPNESKLDKDFAFYLISSPIIKYQLDAGSQQTKIRHTSPDKIKECIAWIPSLDNQRKIAKVLDSLNSKILLNKRIIKELESMAKTLYDYWFLQFEFPNENGKPYKSSGGKMVWNEELKREIPEGWKVDNLIESSLCEDIKAGVDYFETKNYLPTANINGEEITDGDYIKFNNRESRANMQPVKNSVWFAKMKNSIKHLTIPENSDWFISKYILSTGFQGLKCSADSLAYIHCIINSNWFEVYKNMLSHGATQESVNNEDLKNIKFAVPSVDVLKRFSAILFPILEKKFSIIKENQELTALRDFLLPLLMNGQVTFKE